MNLKRPIVTLFIALACLYTPSGPALGHDFFLIARPPMLPGPGVVVIRMHVTDKFPGDARGWRTDKVTHMNIYGPAHATPADMPWPEQDATGAQARIPADGAYLVTVDVSASSITIPGADFDEYIGHEGHDELLTQRQQPPTKDQPVKERYTRFLKTVVISGQPGAASAAHLTQPVGQRIEIVPLADPTTLAPGQSLAVQILYQGQPLPGALLAATHTQHGITARSTTSAPASDDDHSKDHYAFSARTDAQGQVTVPITHAGYQLLRVTHMIPPPDDADFDYASYWASLTFYVANPAILAQPNQP